VLNVENSIFSTVSERPISNKDDMAISIFQFKCRVNLCPLFSKITFFTSKFLPTNVATRDDAIASQILRDARLDGNEILSGAIMIYDSVGSTSAFA
jgi:hypothetical protein